MKFFFVVAPLFFVHFLERSLTSTLQNYLKRFPDSYKDTSRLLMWQYILQSLEKTTAYNIKCPKQPIYILTGETQLCQRQPVDFVEKKSRLQFLAGRTWQQLFAQPLF